MKDIGAKNETKIDRNSMYGNVSFPQGVYLREYERRNLISCVLEYARLNSYIDSFCNPADIDDDTNYRLLAIQTVICDKLVGQFADVWKESYVDWWKEDDRTGFRAVVGE